MRSSLESVRTAFDTAIQLLGYQTYPNGATVDQYPYVIIGEQTEVQDGDQENFGQVSTITIQVIDGWPKQMGLRTRANAILDAITQNLLTKPYSLVIDQFDMPSRDLDNVITQTRQSNTHTINTIVARFKMRLFESGGSIGTDPILDENYNKILDENSFTIYAN